MSARDKLRWGILGAANIARKNWRAIANTGNATVTAVASRNVEASKQFVSQCQREAPMPAAPMAYGTYDELLAAKDVDAVYIPIPTGVRKDWVIRAAQAGKHVLCEKPCAATVADLEQMLAACRRHRVQFMDGVMFMHSLRLARLREVLDDATSIGNLKRITTAFSFRANDDFFATNIRGDTQLEPHGCVGDLGWYCIRLALWAMNWEMPTAVSGRVLAKSKPDGAGVIADFAGDLIFGRGISSSFYCSFITENQQWANLSGDKGYAQMDDFVLPVDGSETSFQLHRYDFQVKGTDFRMAPNIRRITVPEHSHGHADAQETNMFRNFSEQVLSATLNEQWPQMALETQQVMEQCISAAAKSVPS